MKKRAVVILLIAMSCLILYSCKSKKASEADNMILNIGEVTLGSGSDITKAENAVDKLNPREYKQLEHLEELESARVAYDDLVAKNSAEQVMAAIDEIGESISLNDEATIQAARSAYRYCAKGAQKYIVNLDKLKKAEESLSKLKVEDVENKIASIGTVTLKSETDIMRIKLQYDGLTTSEKSEVSNTKVLTKAVEQLDELKRKQDAQEYAKDQAEKSAAEAQWKDERTINIDGKQVWKVYARGSELHFTGNFRGSGYFGITVLDSNQDFFALVTNEIGDCDIDKSIDGLTPGGMYYIKIECTEGTWSCGWSGTYGQ